MSDSGSTQFAQKVIGNVVGASSVGSDGLTKSVINPDNPSSFANIPIGEMAPGGKHNSGWTLLEDSVLTGQLSGCTYRQSCMLMYTKPEASISQQILTATVIHCRKQSAKQ